MKKIQNLLLIAGVAVNLMSCGTKTEGEKTEGEKTEVEATAVCACTAVMKLKGVNHYNGEAYTGACEKKDQHNIVVEHKDFVNGIMVASVYKQKLGDNYITTDSLTFENGAPFNGFKTSYQLAYNAAGAYGGIKYVYDVKEYKDGALPIIDGYISVDYNKGSNFPSHFYYYDGISKTNNFEIKEQIETDVEFEEVFLGFLERVKSINPRFTYFKK
jgi:hypothetical protein